MIESLKARLPGLMANEVKSGKGKATKPEDLMKMYDITIQSFVEISQLPGIEEDESVSAEVQAQVTGYKAFRYYGVSSSPSPPPLIMEEVLIFIEVYIFQQVLMVVQQKFLFT